MAGRITAALALAVLATASAPAPVRAGDAEAAKRTPLAKQLRLKSR